MLIPVAILVRIFVRTSRWSILKVVGITALGTLISSAWLFYASIITNINLGGEWGKIALSLFRLVMIGAIIYGIYRLLKRGNVPAGIFAGAVLILAGAVGNMVDCMFYGWTLDSQDAGFLMGDVIDMIHLPLFKWENCPQFLSFLVGQDGYFFGAVFNVADAYISVAVVYLLLFHYKFFK